MKLRSLTQPVSRHLTLALWALQYLVLTLGVLAGVQSVWLLLVWLALPRFIITFKKFREPRPTDRPEAVPEDVWPLYPVV